MLIDTIRTGAILTTFLAISACSGGGGGDDTPPPQSPAQTCIAPEFPAPPSGAISLEAAFPDLPQIPRLVGLYQAPNDDSRWYALSQRGRVLVFDNTPDVSEHREFLDLEATTYTTDFEEGMLGFAFHPAYPRTPQAFIYYMPTADSARLSRFSLSPGGQALDPASEEVLLELEQPATNHNGGGLAFGPDGYLYLSLGDGGGRNDRFGHGQNTNTLLGALLRLDISVSNGAIPYGIPTDNPFADGTGGRAEIFAYGLRNPWRWSFDRVTGEIWLGDVGQNAIEEIDKIVAGGNFGWPIMEGASCFNTNQCDRTGLQLPEVDYTHTDTRGCSVTGGYVYRGSNPALAGTYIFGDYCNGSIYGINAEAPDTMQTLAESNLALSAFAEDQAGELYALNLVGEAGAGIFRLVAVPPEDSDSLIPETLSASGCFSDTASQATVPEVMAYQVNVPFWSDGANKQRFFAIPNGSQIGIDPAGILQFPDRSVLIKHFYYQDDILETRLMMKHLNGWAGYSYQWNAERTDANLLEGSKSVPIDGFYNHYYPSRNDCLECHRSVAGWSLGTETLQLNNGEQLQALADQGYFSAALPQNLLEQRLFSLDDDGATLEQKARSYLHANCAYCHRPGGPIGNMDLRYTTPLAATGTCDEPPDYGDLGAANPRLLAPGDAANSILALRIADTGADRMPPLASEQVDEAGLRLVEDWIDSLAGCD